MGRWRGLGAGLAAITLLGVGGPPVAPGAQETGEPEPEEVTRYREEARRWDDPLDHYNYGTSLLRTGRWTAARDPLRRAVGGADRVERFGLYNLGLADALLGRRGEGDPVERRQALVDAREAFRAVLRGDPEDTDARWNLELVNRWLREPPSPQGGRGEGQAAGAAGGGADPAAAGAPSTMGPEEAAALLEAAARAEAAARERMLGRNRMRDPVVERNW